MLTYDSIRRIVREETEKSRMTQFLAPGGAPYSYVILPLESRMMPEYRNAVVDGLMRMLEKELGEATVVALPEAKAFLLEGVAAGASLPIAPIRKRDYNIPSQILIEQKKAYGAAERMFCVGLRDDDKVLILDDMISSGGTEISVVKALTSRSIKIAGIGSLYERGDGVKNVFDATGYRAKALARIDVVENRPVVTKFYKK